MPAAVLRFVPGVLVLVLEHAHERVPAHEDQHEDAHAAVPDAGTSE